MDRERTRPELLADLATLNEELERLGAEPVIAEAAARILDDHDLLGLFIATRRRLARIVENQL